MAFAFDLKEFIHQVKTYQDNNKLSTDDLSELCGISCSTMYRILNQENGPSITSFLTICNVIEVDPEYFFIER